MVESPTDDSASEYTALKIERPADGVERIVLNRPETGNKQDTRMLVELEAAFARADDDPDVKCIVLAGAGEDFAGGHADTEVGSGDPLNQEFRERHAASIEEQFRVEREFHFEQALRIRDLSTPTVASVQGDCVLFGVQLAGVCDLIVAADDAAFHMPSLRYGGTAGEMLCGMALWSLGVRKTKEWLWTGDPLYAKDAKMLGLVNRVVSPENLESETLYLARRIALMPATALELTKLSLNYALDEMGQRAALEYHFALHEISHRTDAWKNRHEEAEGARQEGGKDAVYDYVEEPFQNLAAEYGKEDPHIS